MKNRMIVAAMLGMLCNVLVQATPKSITINPVGYAASGKFMNLDFPKLESQQIMGFRLRWIDRDGGASVFASIDSKLSQKINVPLRNSRNAVVAGVEIHALTASGDTMTNISPVKVMFNESYNNESYNDKDVDMVYYVGMYQPQVVQSVK